MQFNQPVFFLFAVCFFIGWWAFRRRGRERLVYLVLASLIFYSWADIRQCLVLIAVGMIGFYGGLGIETRPNYKRLFGFGSITCITGILFVFRYSGFTSSNLEALFAHFKIHLALIPIFSGANHLPVLGIGFYTLQSISYILDVSYGRLPPTRSLVHYFAYLSMFPKLMAGPIERGKHLLTQLEAEPPVVTEAQRWQGTKWIVSGYFLKAVIADHLAPYVDTAFNNPRVATSSLFWWVAVTAFAFQLYCDFSGYSAIALGLGKWMGYDLTANFKNPYSSTSLAEFWIRWHISLSSWLRDYIFFPLNRSRLGKGRPHLSIWITMLVSGLWHGANWTFITWGGLHGLYISLERLTLWPNRLKRLRGGIWLASFLLLLQVWVGWAFFRAENLAQGWQIVKTMFSFQGGWHVRMDLNYRLFLVLGIGWEGLAVLRRNIHFRAPAVLSNSLEVCFISLLMVACVLLRGPGSQFIYFQF